MSGTTQDVQFHIDRLHANGRLRVWSLIVTFFGDAVVPRGARVALSTLQDAMALLDIEPGAVRTALSRLAKDGWVSRQREGRSSFYRLTPEGRYAFDAATRRIYAPGPARWDGGWTIAIAPPEAPADTMAPDTAFTALGPHTWIAPGKGHAAPDGMLVIEGDGSGVPPGFAGHWHLDELGARYRAFAGNWSALDTHAISPANAMIARTLLLHDWRRIVLNDPCLPGELLPPDWAGASALRLMARHYQALIAPSEAWLDSAKLPPQTDIETFQARFRAE